jgi:hypothetical protein
MNATSMRFHFHNTFFPNQSSFFIRSSPLNTHSGVMTAGAVNVPEEPVSLLASPQQPPASLSMSYCTYSIYILCQTA